MCLDILCKFLCIFMSIYVICSKILVNVYKFFKVSHGFDFRIFLGFALVCFCDFKKVWMCVWFMKSMNITWKDWNYLLHFKLFSGFMHEIYVSYPIHFDMNRKTIAVKVTFLIIYICHNFFYIYTRIWDITS